MPINVNLTYRANLANPLTWAQGDANFKTLADNDVFLNSAVEAAALAASQANANANGRQPSNAKLTAIAASVWAANQMILTTGVDTLSMIPVNTYGLNYLNYSNKNEVRNELSINNVDNTSDSDKPVSSATQTALDAKINNSQKGVANGVAALGADGKLPVSQLPPLAVNETFIVNSQAEQLALVAERGDMAFRTDQANTPYVLTTDNPSVFSNWKTLDKTLSDSLAALNVLTPAADRIPFFTGALTAGLQVLTTIGKSILSAASEIAARSAIGISSATPLSIAEGGTSANNVSEARSALGLTGGRNLLINGNFSINQRAYTSGSPTIVANQYTFDRWRVVVSGQSVTFAASGTGNQVTVPAGGMEQVIDGANIEAGVHTLTWQGTATATVNGMAVSNGGQTVSLTSGSNTTVRFIGGTVKECQLEFGSVATGFEKRLRVAELSLCAWYFERIIWPSAYERMAGGQCTATNLASGIGYYQHPKRSIPVITPGSLNTYSIQTANGGGDSANFVSFTPTSQNTFNWACASGTASLTIGSATYLLGKPSGGNYIDISAEL